MFCADDNASGGACEHDAALCVNPETGLNGAEGGGSGNMINMLVL